jgi:hypothetical protein
VASNETELPEGWTFEDDGYQNKMGDSFEAGPGAEYLTVGVRTQLTHYFTELPLSVLRSLLSAHGLHIVDAKDWAVLEACVAADLNDDDTDADPTEPQEHGEDCYLLTDDQRAIARALLARRGKS